MNKFGQKIRDCGRPRISSARPGAAMASVRHWAVPAVMAAALILSGCQTLNPDSAEGESNSLLKAIAIAFVGGAAYWGSTGGGSSDDSPLLPTRVEEPNRLAGSFSEAVLENGRYRITTPLLNAPAVGDGFEIEILIPSDFDLALGTGDCETPSAGVRRCDVTIERGLRFQRLILEPESTTPPVAGDPPPLVSLIPSNNYDIQRILTFREPVIQGTDARGRASFTVLSNVRPSTDDRFVLRFRVEGTENFERVDGGIPCNGRICEVTIQDDESSGTLVIAPLGFDPANDPIPLWRLSLVPDNVDPARNNDNYDIQPTLGFFIGDDLLDAPTVEQGSVTQSGRATFTIFSNTLAPAGGLDVRVNIARERFNFAEPDPGQLAAIAAIVGSQANHIPCAGRICTVTIREGRTSETFTLIPVGAANPDPDVVNRWTVSLVPAGINDPFEIENGNRGAPPIEVENTPTGVRGGFRDVGITNLDLRQISIQTPVLDRVAGSNGFTIDFTLPLDANLRPVEDQMVEVDGQMVPVTVDCTDTATDTACMVTIPEGSRSLDLLFVPTLGADVDSMETGFVDNNREFGAPMVTDETTGEISIQTPTLVTAPGSGGRLISFTIADGFEPVPGQTAVECTGTACTVTIQESAISTDPLLFRPVAIAPTDTPPAPVVIDLPDTPPFAILPGPPPFVVGFDTTEPTVDPDTGEVISGDVTFTVVSDTVAPDGGLTVRFRITGDDFTAMLPDDTELDCPLNVCTVRIPEGSDTAEFILVPDGADTDLFTRWRVTLVPSNNYGIDDDSPTANVINEEFTRIAEGEEDSTLGRNTIVQFGDGLALFRPEGLSGDLDILEIPQAARITADSRRDSFARSGSDRLTQQNLDDEQSTYYGYFADDGGFLPFDTSEDNAFPGFDPQIVGFFLRNPVYNTNTGATTFGLPGIDRAAGRNGYDIGISVGGVSEFTAALEDGTPVDCPRNVCVVTIPVDGFTPPNLVLTPTDPAGFNPTAWILDVAPIPSGNPLSDDILSNSRANSDEAVFYARRGDKLVARFHTTGTFTDTTRVASRTFRPSVTGFSPLPPFDIDNTPIPFDPDPFAFGPPGTVDSATCSPLSGTLLTDCQAERDAYNNRQADLRRFYGDFSANYNGLVANICSQSPRSAECASNSFRFGVQTLLVVDGFGGLGVPFRGDLSLSEGDDVEINRPVAIALAITSTLVATADNAQELVYSYLRDSDGNGLDVNTETGGFFFDQIVGSVDFALYQSGDIPNPLLPITEDGTFSISQIDSNSELLGASNVRTFLYENEFSAIGAWLIPPTAEEVTADLDAPYYAAAAHWFGFETPADRIPRGGEAVYGGIAVGDFRQARFRFADTDSDPLTPLDETVTVESYYVFGGAQFDADFGTGEMDGQFELSAYNPQEAYGNPFLLLSAEPLDTLILDWEGQILPDGGGFANNIVPVREPVVGPDGVQLIARDPVTMDPILDGNNQQILRTRETFAPAGTIFQPERVTGSTEVGVFDDLVDFDRIGGVDPNLPAPIGSETLFSVFGKFFGPDADEVAGELRVFNSRTIVTVERTDPGDPESGESNSVTNSLEVHFTADGGEVPAGRFNQPDIADR